MTDGIPAWDGALGTAGGEAFGASLRALASAAGMDAAALHERTGISVQRWEEMFAGAARVGVGALARMAIALRMKPIEFLQRSGLLSLEAYAMGLDPLYFLPEGPVRYDARIYMREINPRHAVPEADMTKRNPVLRALAEDDVLDAPGKMEVELLYLLAGAARQTGGTL
ncbi:MAG: hypothetical protein NVS1B14_00940 [Vulcanimicrobiaceae bacterium]